MKFGEMKSVGHNIADSLAGGCSMLIGVYGLDVFGEARRSPEGYIVVDFLTGTSRGGTPSSKFSDAIALYPEALGRLCKQHGFPVSEFTTLNARYGVDRTYGGHFTVTVEDRKGRCSSDQYIGIGGRRLRSRR
jgi:hypothetical protein